MLGKHLMRSFHLFTSPGVTPVDGTPHRPYSECYPVLLDGVMIGWADEGIAPGIADSLRHFKVILSLCELFCPSILGFMSFLIVECQRVGGQKLILELHIRSWWQHLALHWPHWLGSVTGI